MSNNNWVWERNTLLLILVIAFLVGLFEQTLFITIAVLLSYIAYMFARFRNLQDWLGDEQFETPPNCKGVLANLADKIVLFKKQILLSEKSIGEHSGRFEKLISAFPDGIVILTVTNEIKWLNGEALDLLGLREDDHGRMINHLVRHPGFASFLYHHTKESLLVIDVPSNKIEGLVRKVEIRILPYGEGEQLILAREITEVERINQMRKDFVSNASHELRTPLTVMKGYIEMLLTNESADKERRAVSLGKVDEQVHKMQTMIEELLALSKLEEGVVEPSSAMINIRDIFEQLDVEFQPLIAQKKQVLRFDINPGGNLKGNKNSILIILRNLVTNAINYTENRGEVRVSWSFNEQGEGVFTITDTGRGIAARHLTRLTERFYRVPENNKMYKAGTGLGLAIVKHELERHEARLFIDSVVGEGSSFRCVFPVARVLQSK